MKAYFTVTTLLDQFNVVFGKATFWGVLSLGFYIAFIFGEFMAEGSSGMLVDGINLLSVLPFCTMMWAGAEVHKTVRSMVFKFGTVVEVVIRVHLLFYYY
jgi:hypothetical protein